MGALVLVTGPTKFPVVLQEVKDALRIPNTVTDFDGQLTDLITEATGHIEDASGHKFITQTWKYILDDFDEIIAMPHYPLQSVSSITYYDSSNNSQTLSTSIYTVDANSKPGQIWQAYNQIFPVTYIRPDAVTITFVCGYGSDGSSVPGRWKRAIMLYIKSIFDEDPSYMDLADNLISQDRISCLALED